MTAWVHAFLTAGVSAAAAACSPGEIVWFVVSAGIAHWITAPASNGRYQGVWSMTAAAAVTAPILASWSLAHGGRLLMVATTVTAGLLGTALCAPLARVLAGADIDGRRATRAANATEQSAGEAGPEGPAGSAPGGDTPP